MTTYLKKASGFDVGHDFARAERDEPIELSAKEHAKPGCVIGYISGRKDHPCGFMRSERIRIHCRKQDISEGSNQP